MSRSCCSMSAPRSQSQTEFVLLNSQNPDGDVAYPTLAEARQAQGIWQGRVRPRPKTITPVAG